MVFDGTLKRSPYSFFELGTQDKEKWNYLYPDAEELEPRRAHDALGKSMVIRVYVDANHTGNMFKIWSHTGTLIYVNNSLIIWFSKRQNTVE